MFVSHLNQDQQRILLTLARSIIQADGVTDEREESLFEAIRSQCPIAVEPADIAIAQLSAHFPHHQAKLALLIELVGIAYADAEYHPKERALIREIAQALTISEASLLEVERWVQRQCEAMADVYRLMEV